jgi:2-aminoadipate transaminase
VKRYLRIHVGGDGPRRAWTASAIADLLADQLGALETSAGAPLPPASTLATRLAVPTSTVRAAYRLLAARGPVRGEPRGQRARARVTRPGAAAPRPRGARAPAATQVAAQAAELALRPVVPANRPARGTPGYITLSSAFLDPRLIPRREIVRCMRDVLRDPGPPTFAHVQGYPPLRRAIAARLQRVGIAADPEHILITIGSQQVIDLVARSLIVRRVATEDPAYIAAKALFTVSDLEVTGLPIDPFAGIDRARWRQLLTARRPALAYLTSSYQNPTGYSYSSDELHQILAWSQELQFGILEDDWGSEMLPGSEHQPTLRALGGDAVLYMNAFTKKTLPSLRVGYVVCSERTLPSLLQAKKLSINGFPAMIEEALFQLIERGHYDEYLARVRTELTARYHHCLALLRSLMPDDVRWTVPGGGPLLWLELPRRVDLPRLLADLEGRKILVNPQDAAFFGRPHLHGFMLGYAFPDRAELTTALEILAELVARPR